MIDYQVDGDGIATVTWDVSNRPMNVLNEESIGAFDTAIDKALRDDAVTTVGFHVDVKHVSPARPGASIVTKAVLESKDGKKLSFSVEAREGERLVGIGRHRRAVIAISELG